MDVIHLDTCATLSYGHHFCSPSWLPLDGHPKHCLSDANLVRKLFWYDGCHMAIATSSRTHGYLEKGQQNINRFSKRTPNMHMLVMGNCGQAGEL